MKPEDRLMFKYKVVSGFSTDSLEKEVNKLIELGWIPKGGVAVSSICFHQAMINVDDKKC